MEIENNAKIIISARGLWKNYCQQSIFFQKISLCHHQKWPRFIFHCQQPVNVLQDIDIDIYAGEQVSILGLSGSGKSTLLNILALLDQAQKGTLRFHIGNQDYIEQYENCLQNGLLVPNGAKGLGYSKNQFRSNFGFIFQTPYTLGNFSVKYNIALPLRLQKKPTPEIEQKVKTMLEAIKLDDKADRTADQLSGGERQRVVIGRALINSPLVVFADEPTGNLDPITGQEIMNLLKSTCREANAALILVTHDPKLAQAYTERTLGIKNGKFVVSKPSQQLTPMDLEAIYGAIPVV